jgi:hypothetical protein
MTPAELLLQEIWARGGELQVMLDGSLLCVRVPRGFQPRLVALQDEIVSLLQKPPEPQSQLDKKQLHKLIREVQDAGGSFRVGESRRGLTRIELPPELVHLHSRIVGNAGEICKLLFPVPKKRSSKPPKRHCLICAPGTGCRTTRFAHYDKFLVCQHCGHACYRHFQGLHFPQFPQDVRWNTPDGCNQFIQPDADNLDGVYCSCPGWPIAPKPVKAKKRKASAPVPVQMQFGLEAAGKENNP